MLCCIAGHEAALDRRLRALWQRVFCVATRDQRRHTRGAGVRVETWVGAQAIRGGEVRRGLCDGTHVRAVWARLEIREFREARPRRVREHDRERVRFEAREAVRDAIDWIVLLAWERPMAARACRLNREREISLFA